MQSPSPSQSRAAPWIDANDAEEALLSLLKDLLYKEVIPLADVFAERANTQLTDTLSEISAKMEDFNILYRKMEAALANLESQMPIGETSKDVPDFLKIVLSDSDIENFSSNGLSSVTMCQTLAQLPGPHWKRIESITYLDVNEHTRERPCLLIKVKTLESGKAIRSEFARLSAALEISHECFLLDFRYFVHVLGFTEHPKIKEHGDPRYVIKKCPLPFKDLKAKVSHKMLLLSTTSVDIALLLCRSDITLNGIQFHCIPFPPEGIPLFCFRCWLTGHFFYYCKAPTPRCGKCSDNHFTKDCNSDILRCPNCAEDHAAWDPRCTAPASRKEHTDSAVNRKNGPEWAVRLRDVSAPNAVVADAPHVTATAPTSAPGPSSSTESSTESSSQVPKKRGAPTTIKKLEKREGGQRMIVMPTDTSSTSKSSAVFGLTKEGFDTSQAGHIASNTKNKGKGKSNIPIATSRATSDASSDSDAFSVSSAPAAPAAPTPTPAATPGNQVTDSSGTRQTGAAHGRGGARGGAHPVRQARTRSQYKN
ncbi:hypothetical protein FPSE_11201 [Fusarium pseudograminearum CS3096]|uniref:CCHC-type domain-containing protein n=1 Tax=Fusarium pseudograminearum (strain CS3096) TaxID=1028729 RepID=K3VXB8_FUSPC|nr:hypothetical protein FPSE_11201 [Fusarium pseudograminearum CS3096]EKJ68625.1 hypothetical protein FPSE_11201 [Fusarium pseudograminearum CS3096]